MQEKKDCCRTRTWPYCDTIIEFAWKDCIKAQNISHDGQCNRRDSKPTLPTFSQHYYLGQLTRSHQVRLALGVIFAAYFSYLLRFPWFWGIMGLSICSDVGRLHSFVTIIQAYPEGRCAILGILKLIYIMWSCMSHKQEIHPACLVHKHTHTRARAHIYIYIYISLTYSMKQSPSWEANSKLCR
jgi:hypothetical protein